MKPKCVLALVVIAFLAVPLLGAFLGALAYAMVVVPHLFVCVLMALALLVNIYAISWAVVTLLGCGDK
jgi:hypothetical protein